jgi:predicted dehydrogenase
MTKQITRIAVVGAGGFARFAVSEFVKVPGVQLAGVYDPSLESARLLQQIDTSATVYDSYDALLNDASVQLVYIATPPYLHYEQSKAALHHGKHVICEKPAAIRPEHAAELRNLAAERNLLFVVNLMQRYNPLYRTVQELINQKVLGEFLHGYFENYASDEFLPEQHWFWDETKSGGIFIEHGVHFFDMFAGWLGEGQVIASQKLKREGNREVWDRVQATVLYAKGLVNFYHGFDQPKLMDRQEMRLQFEKGDVTLFEWVPTRLQLNAICDQHPLEAIKRIFPNAIIETTNEFSPVRQSKGRFKALETAYKIRLYTGRNTEKQALYQQLVQEMLRDQLHWLQDNAHVRIIDQHNAVSSLKLAVEANELAIKIR